METDTKGPKLLYIANARIPTEKAHGVQIMHMCAAFANVLGSGAVTLLVSNRKTIPRDPFTYYDVPRAFNIKKVFCIDLGVSKKAGFYLQWLTFAFFAVLSAWRSRAGIIYARDELTLYLLSFISRKTLIWETHTARSSWLVRGVSRRVDGVVAISQGLKDFHIEKNSVLPGKVTVAHDGVDLGSFGGDMLKGDIRDELGLPRGKKIICYVGKYRTMGEEKGVDGIIAAAAVVAKRYKEAALVLVGMNQSEARDAQWACIRAGLTEDQYRIIAHVHHKVALRYIQAADVLVMNYPAQEHYVHFMSPLKLFEYMASGVPIVSSDLPSVREVLTDESAVLVAPEDSEALARGIEGVFGNSDHGMALAHKALEDVEKYTWDTRAKHIADFVGYFTRVHQAHVWPRGMRTRKFFKALLIRLLYVSGTNTLVEKMWSGRVYFVGYHSISSWRNERKLEAGLYPHLSIDEGVFEEHIMYLKKNGHTFVTFGTLEGAIKKGASKPTVMYFDDGFRDNLFNALPVLKRHNVPAVLFLTTGLADRTHMLGTVRKNYEQIHGHHPSAEQSPIFLSWDEVRDLSDEGIEINGHGVTHTRFDTISKQDVQKEARESRAKITEMIGKEPVALSYPHGRVNDAAAIAVGEAGYRYAVTTQEGTNKKKDLEHTALRLKKIAPKPYDSLVAFKVKLYALNLFRK